LRNLTIAAFSLLRSLARLFVRPNFGGLFTNKCSSQRISSQKQLTKLKRKDLVALALCWLMLNGTTPAVATQGGSVLDLLPAILSNVKKLPRKIDFKVAQPSLRGGNEYIIELNRWQIPSNRSNPIRTTDNLQAAIDWAKEQGFNRIVIPDGHFLIECHHSRWHTSR